MKILLLEDDEMLGETLKEMLEEEGYDTVWCKTSDEVIDITFEEKFDMYVFDIGVPGMEGTDLLRALREGEDDTPAIFVSARVDIESIAEGFRAGAFDYIKKPFYPEELLIRIKNRLNPKLESNFIECGEWKYYPKEHKIVHNFEEIVVSGVTEKLIEILFNAKANPVDKNFLIDTLQMPSAVALRVAINTLKKKTGLPVKSVRGVGYFIEGC